MRFKRKLILVLILVTILTVIQFLLPADSRVVIWYDRFVFRPFQSLRNTLFSVVPFSVGDILYALGGLALLVVIIRWLYFLVRFRTHKHDLALSLLHSVVSICGIYILFVLGWGGNYYKQSLSQYWNLQSEHTDKKDMVAFDKYLVRRLNSCVTAYQEQSFRKINKQAQDYYKDYTDSRIRAQGMRVKSSLYGFWMQHLGIQGYYNPFTGEAQVNRYLPNFMLPFVICHEMAHQAGIAAEDDANLLAYAVGTTSPDSLFRYSSFLNIWLYTHALVKATDTSLAKQLRSELNPLTRAHLDTLRAIRKRYESDFSEYSGALYDSYLRLHHQKEGIGSYNLVAASAWAWEQRRRPRVIAIP